MATTTANTPWFRRKVTQGFKWSQRNTDAHSGIDITMPLGTPITSPVAGQVAGSSCHEWGIQVDVRFSANGQSLVWSALHLMQLAPGIKTGSVVQPGTLLGYSGGVSSGVPCPTARKFSDGPHLHMELTHGSIPPYTTYNPRRPTGSSYPLNPNAFLSSLQRANGLGISDQAALGGVLLDATGSPVPILAGDFAFGNVSLGLPGGDESDADPGAGAAASGMLAEIPGFFGICAALDVAEQFTPYKPPVGLTGALDTPGYTMKWAVKNSIAFFVRMTLWALGAFLLFAIFAAMVNINKWLQEAGGIVLPLAIAAM